MEQLFSTSAVILRRIDYGDNDLILTFFTPDQGKVSVIAKSAKKSIKRFGGALELFSLLQAVYKPGRGRLSILQEVTLKQPFENIRSDIRNTAYASYWAELINEWVEEGENQDQVYMLFCHVLEELNSGSRTAEVLSILFQIKFMTLSGFCPNLTHCSMCNIEMEKIKKNNVIFDYIRGGVLCQNCADSEYDPEAHEAKKQMYLSKGTIKQLLWIETCDLKKAGRIKFTEPSLKEGLRCMEAFVQYHLGKSLRSLNFLRRLKYGV